MNAIKRLEEEGACVLESEQCVVSFALRRIPFFLEPDYMTKEDTFWEPHVTRMTRKFGSLAAFNRVKASHGLIPRGAEVGLDASVGYTDDALDARRQSCTMKSHRLVQYVAKVYSLETAEALYDQLNKKHFLEQGILNDVELLLSCCRQCGLESDLPKLAAFLESSELEAEVMEVYNTVQRCGIHSIPTLIVAGGVSVISGAARADEVYDVLQHLLSSGNVEEISRPPLFSLTH